MSNTEPFYIKSNDTSPAFQRQLLDAAGTAIDISGNLGVRFHMSELDGTNVVDAAATVVTAASGIIRYDWLAADTATPGTYNAEWEVTYSDGSIETFPNSGYEIVQITDDLA